MSWRLRAKTAGCPTGVPSTARTCWSGARAQNCLSKRCVPCRRTPTRRCPKHRKVARCLSRRRRQGTHKDPHRSVTPCKPGETIIFLLRTARRARVRRAVKRLSETTSRAPRRHALTSGGGRDRHHHPRRGRLLGALGSARQRTSPSNGPPPPADRSGDIQRPRTVLQTARCTATARMPHQRRLQPARATRRTTGAARLARTRASCRTKAAAAAKQLLLPEGMPEPF